MLLSNIFCVMVLFLLIELNSTEMKYYVLALSCTGKTKMIAIHITCTGSWYIDELTSINQDGLYHLHIKKILVIHLERSNLYNAYIQVWLQLCKQEKKVYNPCYFLLMINNTK